MADNIIWTDHPPYIGPYYPSSGHDGAPDYEGWADLIAAGDCTSSIRLAIAAVSDNEGDFGAVQSYDSQVISVGIMQKTVDPQGGGELPNQVIAFQAAVPAKYQALLVDKGWSLTQLYGKPTLAFRPAGAAPPLTGDDLIHFIRNKTRPQDYTAALEPWHLAGRDSDWRKRQVLDFVARCRSALAKHPNGVARPVSDFLTSERASALVVDQDVNRPGYVAADLGVSIAAFFAANPGVTHDPSPWTDVQRRTYEPAILEEYHKRRRMNANDKRWAAIVNNPHLSADVRSMQM
jgi:hypothetical protein